MPRWGRKKESVHRLLNVKGGTHFAVLLVFLALSAGWTQLHRSSMCNRASVHRVQVWTTIQPLKPECHPSGTNLGFNSDHPQELNSSGVSTSTVSRGGLIMKLMWLHLQGLSLHQPLPGLKVREGSLALCSQGHRFSMSRFLGLRKRSNSVRLFLAQRWRS